jgi:surfeit locus 1 family protein
MTHRRDVLTNSEFSEVEEALEKAQMRKPTPISWAFVGFMMVLAGVCIGLGFWQLARLEQKLEMISNVEERVTGTPISLPPLAEWPAFDAPIYDFQRVELTGTFVPDQTVMVFTELVAPKGSRKGIGYWVVTPMQLRDGGTVLVNRGFVPEGARKLFDAQAGVDAALMQQQTITGIARKSEKPNSFTPGPDINQRIEHVRDVARLSAMIDQNLAPIAPIYVNADAAGADDLPQGGETKLTFPNRHMEYALTWFAFAAVAFVMTGFWLWRQRRN